jgi:hypothetical protein
MFGFFLPEDGWFFVSPERLPPGGTEYLLKIKRETINRSARLTRKNGRLGDATLADLTSRSGMNLFPKESGGTRFALFQGVWEPGW